jgi:hypothetical protein
MYHKVILLTDAALNIAPDLQAKAEILQMPSNWHMHSASQSQSGIACCSGIRKWKNACNSGCCCTVQNGGSRSNQWGCG